MKIDDNVVVAADGTTVCKHCSATLGTSPQEPLEGALRRERPSSQAGPGVHADPGLFTDRPIVLRQVFCPSCLVLLATEIVPADEDGYRRWSVDT